MSDQGTGPEGQDADAAGAVKADKIQKQLEEVLKRNEELQALVDKTAAENKAEREKKRKAAEAAGEYEKALELKNAELTEAMGELEKLKIAAAEAEVLRAKATELEEIKTKQREKLLASIPEDKREKYGSLDLNTLEALVEDFVQTDTKLGLPKNGAGLPKGGAKKWADMSAEERVTFARDHTTEEITALMKG